MPSKKKAEAFETESLYRIRVSRVYTSETFRTRFLPAHEYTVKGKVAAEIDGAGALKSSMLRKSAADLKTQDSAKS